LADIHIVREHALGLSKARKIAYKWAEQVEAEFGMTCTYTEGKTGDDVSFTRSGVKGSLLVTKEHFELRAQLGFLVGAFKHTIEAEIVKHLDALLAPKASDTHAAKAARARAHKSV